MQRSATLTVMAPDSSDLRHQTVLAEETVALLAPALGPGRWAVDCTAGGGGHTEGLLATGARVLALDRDPAALDRVRARLGPAPGLVLVHGDFGEIEAHLAAHVGGPVHAVVADLGLSSPQLDAPQRGFSFAASGPLDMRMDPTAGLTLEARLAEVDEATLTRVLKELGEERRARAVARTILRARDEGALADTAALAAVVRRAVGRTSGRIDAATRTFQALRIWVNDELGALDRLLASLPAVLAPGGRVAILAFHSLEDRRVKHAFRRLSTGCICPPDLPVCRCGKTAAFELLGRRATKASEAEVAKNPRARSVRLRGLVRREAADA